MPFSCHPPRFDHVSHIWREVQIVKLLNPHTIPSLLLSEHPPLQAAPWLRTPVAETDRVQTPIRWNVS
jgi:hypothetical protein